jgi:mRNA-degrading endonuclease RelE of RelBE toxin-antitoxin system
MNYTVLWTPSAERDLTELWLRATDRGAVRSAADTLDSLLRIDPHLRGESRYESVRIVHADPLGVDIDVDEGNRTVWVLRVWRYARGGGTKPQ